MVGPVVINVRGSDSCIVADIVDVVGDGSL